MIVEFFCLFLIYPINEYLTEKIVVAIFIVFEDVWINFVREKNKKKRGGFLEMRDEECPDTRLL